LATDLAAPEGFVEVGADNLNVKVGRTLAYIASEKREVLDVA